jgi:putative transposase
VTSRRSLHEPGHAHQLTFSCFRRFPFLKAERTCQWLAESITEARITHAFSVFAFVFMPDHVHLIIHPRNPEADLPAILKGIKSPVGRRAIAHIEEQAPEWLERVSRRRGNRIERLFWQPGGGFDRNVFQAATLLKMIDYIHANPVRKRLVERPRDWRWSSAAWFDDGSDIPLPVDPIPKDWFD